MTDQIKNGKEIVDDFFSSLETIPGLDEAVLKILENLYKDDKLTTTNLSNALLNQRKEAVRD